jgi:Tfp pilus assembly protein PilF
VRPKYFDFFVILALLAACPAKRDTSRARTYLDLAKDLLGKGQDTAAEAEVKKAIALDPDNEEAYVVHGLIYVVRAAHTRDLVERENCLAGPEADGLQKDADDAMRVAVEKFTRATELAPDYGEAWLDRAVAAIHFGDWELAISNCRKALEHTARVQSEPLVRANLGWALYHRKEMARATTELLQAVQTDPRLCVARYRLASVLFARDLHDEAADQLAYFLPAVLAAGKPSVCAPPVLEALYLGGQNSLRTRDLESAVAWFQQCIEAAPRSCVARKCKSALAELGTSP